MASRAAVALISAWIAVVAGLGAWLARTPNVVLREQLKTLQFWWLEALVALGLALGILVARDIWRGLDRRDLVRMAILAGVALGLTVFVAPRTNRIFYDEQIYQSIGQNLADLRRAQMCNDGTVEYGRLQCWSGEYNKQPYAYPHLLSLAYRVFGVRPSIAFAVNALVMASTVWAVYLLTLILFDDRTAALLAGLLVALTPQQILWSATAAVEPSASLACAVALVGAAEFCRSRSTVALAATGVAAAYAVQFRAESLLIVPVIGLLFWQRAREELARPRLWWVGLLAVALAAVHVAHLFAVRGEGWGTSDARLSIGYVAANLSVNGRFFLGDERFPVLVTLLAIVGLMSRPRGMSRLPIALYFAAFFGIHLLFYAGSYNYGADVRYSLMTYPAIAVLGGLGAARVAARVAWIRPTVPAVALVAAAIVFQFLWYLPLVRATGEEAWAARADVRFAEDLVRGLGRHTYVLTHNPGMFHVWGVNAGQMSTLAANPTYLDYLATRYAGGVYLHWNFWCNVHDRSQQDLCRQAFALKPTETVREFRVRDQRFAFYRFRTPQS